MPVEPAVIDASSELRTSCCGYSGWQIGLLVLETEQGETLGPSTSLPTGEYRLIVEGETGLGSTTLYNGKSAGVMQVLSKLKRQIMGVLDKMEHSQPSWYVPASVIERPR